jgi:hypothetical protein
MRESFVAILTLCIALTASFSSQPSTGYTQLQKVGQRTASVSCNRENASSIVRQQLDASKTIDDAVQRIAVLVRAADLLWPSQKDQARAAFIEAFDLATVNFNEKGDKRTRLGAFAMASTPDQRYVVIGAIAKRDAAWAGKLIDQLLKPDAKETADKSKDSPQEDSGRAEKLFSMALALLATDTTTAGNIVRTSFRYPASLYLPMFLYRLADTNQQAADQLYQEALAAYREKPMNEFLYLSAYPFGNKRDAGEMRSNTMYGVPRNFAPNASLRRVFVQTLLQRANQALQNSVDDPGDERFSDNGQIWLALTRLEPQVAQSLPDLLEASMQAKGKIFSTLSPKSQTSVNRTIDDQNRPKKSFEEQVEAADRQRDVTDRDRDLAFAVMGAPPLTALDPLLSAVQKIDDPKIKEPLLDWIYFGRAQKAITDRRLDEARKLAARVGELDQRAFLYSQIAEETLKQADNLAQARDVLDEVVTAATKAPNTIVTARALLAAAYLYTRIDMSRAISILGDAVKCINHIESPDFSRQFEMRKIEGKNFGSYAAFQTPGFKPENAFREMGKLDFDGALFQASNFSDKSLRSLTTLAIIEPCVQQTLAPVKPDKTKKGE